MAGGGKPRSRGMGREELVGGGGRGLMGRGRWFGVGVGGGACRGRGALKVKWGVIAVRPA